MRTTLGLEAASATMGEVCQLNRDGANNYTCNTLLWLWLALPLSGILSVSVGLIYAREPIHWSRILADHGFSNIAKPGISGASMALGL